MTIAYLWWTDVDFVYVLNLWTSYEESNNIFTPILVNEAHCEYCILDTLSPNVIYLYLHPALLYKYYIPKIALIDT